MTPHTTRLLVLTHGDAADPIPSAAQQTASVIAASASSRRPTSANRLDWLVNDLAGSGPSPGLNCAQRCGSDCQSHAATRSAPGRALTTTAPPRKPASTSEVVVW